MRFPAYCVAQALVALLLPATLARPVPDTVLRGLVVSLPPRSEGASIAHGAPAARAPTPLGLDAAQLKGGSRRSLAQCAGSWRASDVVSDAREVVYGSSSLASDERNKIREGLGEEMWDSDDGSCPSVERDLATVDIRTHNGLKDAMTGAADRVVVVEGDVSSHRLDISQPPTDHSPEFGAVFDSVFDPVLVAIGVKSPVETIPRVETLAALLGVE